MPQGWYGFICAICFKGLTTETCYVDKDGDLWDFCKKGPCAEEAGFPPQEPKKPKRPQTGYWDGV